MLSPEDGDRGYIRSRSPFLVPSDDEESRRPRSPITKRVDHVFYESNTSKFSHNPWSTPPEFLKVFSDAFVHTGGRVEFECVLFGNPRPRITWFFNNSKITFDDCKVENTCDTCRFVIPTVREYHYGEYTILAENEVGQAHAKASVRRP